METTEQILSLVKAKLGISTTVRDTYLTAIIKSVTTELRDQQGLTLLLSTDSTDENEIQKTYLHLMFVVDLATWRYQNKDSAGIPRNLQFRLHNLMISNKSLIVNGILIVSLLPSSPQVNTVYILPNGTKQMYINGVWNLVDFIDGLWVIV